MHADNGNCILRKSSPQYNLFTLSSFLHVYYLHGLTRKPNMIIDARADNAFYSIYRTHNAVRSLNKNSAAYTERCSGMHAMSRQTEDDGWSWCSTSLIVLRPQWTARNTACKHLPAFLAFNDTHLFERGAPRPQLGGCYWVSRDEEGCSVTPHDVFLVHLMTSNSVPPRNIGKCYIDAKFQHDALTAAMTSRYANFRICLKTLLQIHPNFIPWHS